MGRGEGSLTDRDAAAARSAHAARPLAELVAEYARVDLWDAKLANGESGEVIAVRAAVFGAEPNPIAEGEWTDVGIPGDEESYDAALGYSCSTAELALARKLVGEGMSEEDAEELVEIELIRSDMPVY